MKQFNIIIAGLPGSGKTTLIEAIKDHLEETSNIIKFRDHELVLIEYTEDQNFQDISGVIYLIDYSREKESKEYYQEITKKIKGNKNILVYTKAPLNSYNNDIFYYERNLLGQEIILEKILDEIDPTESLKR